MLIRRIIVPAAFAAALAALPLSAARAQYFYPPCTPFPLTWPFCAVGAAAAIVTAPFRALAYPYYARPYYYRPYYRPYYYPAPGYYGAAYPYGRPY